MSMKPGQTTRPGGISMMEVSDEAGRSRATREIRSASISTSNVPSRPLAGSTTRPPLSSRFIFDAAGEKIEHGHSNGDTVRHLFEDDRVRAVGHFRCDLDAAIHRAGMHDDHVGFRALHAFDRHAEDGEVLA